MIFSIVSVYYDAVNVNDVTLFWLILHRFFKDYYAQTILEEVIIFMYHTKKAMRKMMNMDMMPDMDMSSTTKVFVAGAMVWFGAKMLMEELMD